MYQVKFKGLFHRFCWSSLLCWGVLQFNNSCWRNNRGGKELPSGLFVKVIWRSCSILTQTPSSSSSLPPTPEHFRKRRLIHSAAQIIAFETISAFAINKLLLCGWCHIHTFFFPFVFTDKLIYSRFYFSVRAESHPLPPLRAAVAPAQWTMIGFPRLENEDSHGIPMEQHRGEIESTTVNYSHTHTLETSHSLIQTRTRNANYSRKKKPECGQHRVVHCSRWDWGAECWVVVWCNIKT